MQQYEPNIDVNKIAKELDSYEASGGRLLGRIAIQNYFTNKWLLKAVSSVTIDEAINLLKHNHPVIIGGSWVDWELTSQAPYMVKKTNSFITGHFWYATQIVAETKDVTIVKCVNSWGENWWEGGHFYLNIKDRMFTLSSITPNDTPIKKEFVNPFLKRLQNLIK